MLKRTFFCVFLLAVIACESKYSPSSPSNTSPVFIAIGPGNSVPLSVTFQGQLITAPGSFLFTLPPGSAAYTIEGTFSNGVLEISFSGADLDLGGVRSGSVVVEQGPSGAVMSPCGVAWSLSGTPAKVGQKIKVKFTVTADSSQACG